MVKRIIKLTQTELVNLIIENVTRLTRRGMITEMATFGTEKWGNDTYRIAVHGASTKDRPIPHIHIYLNKDDAPYLKFNFEISLVDILCCDEINLVYQLDKRHSIKRTNRAKCSWTGYSNILEGFRKFLFTPTPISKYGTFIDNLDRAIYEWNRETDFNKTENGGNPLQEYIESKGLTILPQYRKYFASK